MIAYKGKATFIPNQEKIKLSHPQATAELLFWGIRATMHNQ